LINVETENAGSVSTSITDKLYSGGSLGLNLDGTGITAGIWDGGQVREPDSELTRGVTSGDTSNRLSYHATHITGTVGASGVDLNAKGMATNANLLTYDYGNDTRSYERFIPI